jgi:hypothetical protein
MITLEDCIAFCGLTQEEVLAVAEHEHVPEIVATALAEDLLSHEHGSEKVRDMIIDDVRQAQLRGDRKHVVSLLHVLHHFLTTHPEARPSHHPWSGGDEGLRGWRRPLSQRDGTVWVPKPRHDPCS